MAPLFFRIRTVRYPSMLRIRHNSSLLKDKPIYGIYGQQGQCSGGIPFAINANEQQFQAFKQRVETGGQPQQPSTQVASSSTGTQTPAAGTTSTKSATTTTGASTATTTTEAQAEDATNAAETRPAATSPTGSQSEPTGTTGSDSTTGPDPTTEDTVKGQESTEQQRRSAKWVMRRQLMRWG